ncbi:MAG TPA: pentapeptide repeat-containing protein [Pyrinomonadaceae bacterium]|jgi:hypothetical protein|nr:pentapeptide repeat-containing protein [Pyrinomonadaceae bacterium]
MKYRLKKVAAKVNQHRLLVVFIIVITVLIAFILRQVDFAVEWKERSEIITFLIVVLGILSVLVITLWNILLKHLKPASFEEKKDFILLIAQILGGTTLLISLVATWQSIKHTNEELKINQKKIEEGQRISEENLKLSIKTLEDTQKRQIAERYARAVEQLGSREVKIRIGAIYGLGQIAMDSEDFYWPIIRVLTAYIKENAGEQATVNTKSQGQVTPDIQSALNVLGWRKHRWRDGEGQRLELEATNLRGVILKAEESDGAHFEGVLLSRANLENAKLRGIHLEGAVLAGANLKNAILYGAHMEDTDLTGADLEGADLQDTIGLTIEQVRVARNYWKAYLPDYIKEKLQIEE